jgi:hypothetical protein
MKREMPEKPSSKVSDSEPGVSVHLHFGSGLGGAKDDETHKDRKRRRGSKSKGQREMKHTMKKYGPRRG